MSALFFVLSAVGCQRRTAASPATFETYTEKVGDVSFKMVAVGGGTFSMGCDPGSGDCFEWEMPAHSVTLSDYHIGETEVTQRLWKAVMGSDPRIFNGCYECPVELVGWDEAQDFVRKLNAMTGKRYRLPTEAEWEYAAKGGKSGKNFVYSGSNDPDPVAWHVGNVGTGTHPVKEKQPNELGLYDMSGNVWEWCQDWYGDYAAGNQTDPTGPRQGEMRVIRGGSWNQDAIDCRVIARSMPDNRGYLLGFRLAASR
jgi:sulfatase modifying factor 1